ncbi:hypothetical protein I0Q12_02235 [Rhodococcus sp. CX]|uniref:hypothetical protein n=1 Tax=Rhodococcus sp. CX TaxID=2789880 RepID=UPI0018CD68A7|nr:hypothetical protein [Rhodococcus sp. CX]MBH0118417.1 hypothetical protein [Rhodococcus sp. CX]
MSDSVLYDLPGEFISSMAESSGYCDAQAVLPRDGHYIAFCTCGRWNITSPTLDECLELASIHTAETDGT